MDLQRKNFKNIIKLAGIYFREIDLVLFATVVAVSLFSIINIYGIVGSESPFFQRHVVFIGIGLVTMVAFSFFNYRYLKNYSFPVLTLYFTSIALLALTFYSRTVRGTNSWIVFGALTFEPAELAKLAIIIFMAKYFSRRHVYIHQFKNIIIPAIYFAIPAIIIIEQPDLGSAVVLGLIWVSMLMAAGINKKHFVILLVVAMITAGLSWSFVLKPYQKIRVVSFLNPYQDPRGSGYNVIQSKIAIGSGSWFGKGLGKGSQAVLGFLPESHNDFIFAALAEQFGFAGVSFFLATILLILYRIIDIGSRTVTNFGKLFSLGLAIFIFLHVFISAAVNIGLLPVTGISTSFLSYGGSHTVSLMAGLGILQSIKRYG